MSSRSLNTRRASNPRLPVPGYSIGTASIPNDSLAVYSQPCHVTLLRRTGHEKIKGVDGETANRISAAGLGYQHQLLPRRLNFQRPHLLHRHRRLCPLLLSARDTTQQHIDSAKKGKALQSTTEPKSHCTDQRAAL